MTFVRDALNLEQLLAEIDSLAARSWRDASGSEFRRRHFAPLIMLAEDYRREAERFEREMEEAIRRIP